MSHELDPKVGRWYRRLDDEQLFKVISIDEDDGLVEIKTFDGEELDSTEWVELDLEAAEAPEDYVDPDEKSDDDDDEVEAEEEGERRGSRDDWDDDDDDDLDDEDDEDDDEDYDSDR